MEAHASLRTQVRRPSCVRSSAYSRSPFPYQSSPKWTSKSWEGVLVVNAAVKAGKSTTEENNSSQWDIAHLAIKQYSFTF